MIAYGGGRGGGAPNDTTGAGGGGGGTYVVRAPYNTNASILIIAGGGGGREWLGWRRRCGERRRLVWLLRQDGEDAAHAPRCGESERRRHSNTRWRALVDCLTDS